MCSGKTALLWCLLLTATSRVHAQTELPEPLRSGKFTWESSGPLVSPAQREDVCYSYKDPTVVQVDGRWHLFGTIRSERRSHQIEYLAFDDWSKANAAERHILKISDAYFCAPQVFYFRPQKKWYLIYQVANKSGEKPGLLPAFSTTENIADPASWTKPALLYNAAPPKIAGWIDFWIICDETHAHLFATSNNNKMWRSATRLTDFPHGWDDPQLVLEGDIFEASHTYRLRGHDQYLTVIEAQGPGGRRYYKAYTAPRLDAKWTPLADTWQQPFAGATNVAFAGEKWTDSISHGELLRASHDERLEVDPDQLQFLYQGVSDARRGGKPYGQIPWELGLLKLKMPAKSP